MIESVHKIDEIDKVKSVLCEECYQRLLKFNSQPNKEEQSPSLLEESEGNFKENNSVLQSNLNLFTAVHRIARLMNMLKTLLSHTSSNIFTKVDE